MVWMEIDSLLKGFGLFVMENRNCHVRWSRGNRTIKKVVHDTFRLLFHITLCVHERLG